uniref:Amiloride-sensitive sodium channel n=1 Tax=Bursaphelenchus xylophilus TaxID=6326 RepID=A0A1I7SAE9_BURXY
MFSQCADYESRFTKTAVLQQAQVLALNDLTSDEIKAASYTLDNFILAWYFNNAKVNASFFNEFIDPTFGLCYQFNSNNTGTTLVTNRAGSYFGLRSLALVNQRSPDGTLQYLPTTIAAGLKVGINYQNEDPAMENYAINIGVGTETMISLELTEVNRASHPYGDCSDDETLNYYTSFNYTLTYCFRSCIQRRTISACGCANPVYAKPDNASYCTLDDLSCVFLQKTAQQDGSNFSVASECGCNPSCSDTNFDIIVSVGKSPSLDYAPLVDVNPVG